jgi:putative phage-type endonuclease
MKIIDCDQGSAEWLEARTGRVTASSVGDAIRFLRRGDKKGEESAARASYKAALVSEILTGRASDTYVSSYMQHGTEMEPLARVAYERKHDVMVETVGFVIHPAIDRSGASPDGLVGDDGGLEIKCPQTSTHLGYIFANELPAEYEPQVHWNMACTGRQWWDFVSFDPRLSPRYQLFVKRVYRDEMRCAEIELGVIQFLREVDETIERLKTLCPEPEQFKKQLRESLDQADGMGITDEDIAWIERIHDEQLGGSHA